MINRALLASEINRPYAKRLLLVQALILGAAVAVFFVALQPARENSYKLAQERQQFEQQAVLRRAYRGREERVSALYQVLPDLRDKMKWTGTPTDFSRAVLDAANMAGVTLEQEVNEVHDQGSPVRYVKKLEFSASWEALRQFLKQLNELPLIVVVSSISAGPIEGGEKLSVTLRLTGFSEVKS